MVTTDEIRKRVEEADRARQESRADAAAAIAIAVEERTKVRAELAALEASIATQISASATVMSLDELAEFTGIPMAELRGNDRAARTRKGARSASARGRSTRTRTRAADTAPSTAGNAGGSADQPG